MSRPNLSPANATALVVLVTTAGMLIGGVLVLADPVPVSEPVLNNPGAVACSFGFYLLIVPAVVFGIGARLGMWGGR